MRQTIVRYRALLVAYLLPQRGKVALLAVLLLGAMGLQLAGPLVQQQGRLRRSRAGRFPAVGSRLARGC